MSTATAPLAPATGGAAPSIWWQRLPLAVALAALFAWLLWSVSARQALLLLVGLGLGWALASQKFGFTTAWRILVQDRNPAGVYGQVTLIALLALVSIPMLAYFPETTAALGPPSWSLLIGAFVFGLAMQVADGCGSGTLYKAGMGVPLNMAILPLFILGSFAGSAQVNSWVALGSIAPIGLVPHWGAGGALAVFVAFNLLIAGQPWGIVYGFGLWGAKAMTTLGLFDPTTNAFWSDPGHALRLSQSLLLDVTSITDIGILAGAWWVAIKHPRSSKPHSRVQWGVSLVAGFLLGYSSRLAFGCNIGAMVSGISTGSVHGWIWVAAAFLGSLVGLRLRRALKY